MQSIAQKTTEQTSAVPHLLIKMQLVLFLHFPKWIGMHCGFSIRILRLLLFHWDIRSLPIIMALPSTSSDAPRGPYKMLPHPPTGVLMLHVHQAQTSIDEVLPSASKSVQSVFKVRSCTSERVSSSSMCFTCVCEQPFRRMSSPQGLCVTSLSSLSFYPQNIRATAHGAMKCTNSATCESTQHERARGRHILRSGHMSTTVVHKHRAEHTKWRKDEDSK